MVAILEGYRGATSLIIFVEVVLLVYRRKLNSLKKRVRDVKDGKVKTIPFEEVMLYLKEKTKGHGR